MIVQVAVIEFARNVLGKEDANSTEFEGSCRHPAVIFMPEGSKTHMGGTMRLGVRATILQDAESHAGHLYSTLDGIINERHRHRCGRSNVHIYLLTLENKQKHRLGQPGNFLFVL